MDLLDKRLIYFYQAVQHGGIRAAADTLGLAPSAVSRQITSLERTLGTALFERHIKGAIPTEAGREVLVCYQEFLNQENLLKEKITALQGLNAGNITISTGAGYVKHLSEVVAKFCADYPNIHVQIDIHGTSEIVRKILDNETQLGIVYHFINHHHIRSHFQTTHRLCVFLPKNHALANRKSIDLKEIYHERWALTDTTHGIRHLVESMAGHHSIRPALLCNDMNLLKDYARCGGITLLPEFMYYPEDVPTLAAIPLTEQAFTQAKSQIITRRGKALSAANLALIDRLKEMFRGLKGGHANFR
ncbi:hypothetical protein B0181_06585 [Moraxella caviae]|uniref:HTH-type transcriptional activator CmpR n=1 Tax=Moraxella caviae TaxID=34060 RepID=A0A1T0A251_9GAMM|nr:LysR family transcriptional regulator [Moraxella caviae]OOR89629.1 hypothetical protein B0181_06585 [Moraxella caviae]STZ10317.1 HTH-type transcriptional activator CmpR [Moraxella caviae]VEW12641.1 HTH-type transcriptional activator CmpR [Moraxella caviae]